MAKYSTGDSGGSGDGDACELCGSTSNSLREASVAGADLLVCPDCAPHDDAKNKKQRSDSKGRGSEERDRRKKAAQNVARTSEVWDGDSSHWEEEGTDYDRDPLPYLVADYGERAESARQDAGLQREELADELGMQEADLLAIEQGRATQAGIGGSVIEALEDRLDVDLAEQ